MGCIGSNGFPSKEIQKVDNKMKIKMKIKSIP